LQVGGEACHLDVYSNLKCDLIIENGYVTWYKMKINF
jgi:hypothetical protein